MACHFFALMGQDGLFVQAMSAEQFLAGFGFERYKIFGGTACTRKGIFLSIDAVSACPFIAKGVFCTLAAQNGTIGFGNEGQSVIVAAFFTANFNAYFRIVDHRRMMFGKIFS